MGVGGANPLEDCDPKIKNDKNIDSHGIKLLCLVPATCCDMADHIRDVTADLINGTPLLHGKDIENYSSNVWSSVIPGLVQFANVTL